MLVFFFAYLFSDLSSTIMFYSYKNMASNFKDKMSSPNRKKQTEEHWAQTM